METDELIYFPKYHPQTAKIMRDAINSALSLLVITLLTLSAVWFISRSSSSPVILGTQTENI